MLICVYEQNNHRDSYQCTDWKSVEILERARHITQWAFASDDWEAPNATNDLTVGGKFSTTMAAKDKSVSFDFSGTYTNFVPNEFIEYLMSNDPIDESARKVSILFSSPSEDTTKIVETFDPETENPEEMQRTGWQAILDNFKKHVESK